MNKPDYILPLEEAFNSFSNPPQAEKMTKYMRYKFIYFGIMASLRKQIMKEFKDVYGLIPEGNLKDIVKWCWQQPEREYQYFAMDFIHRRRKNSTKKDIELYQFLLENKSWWDTVDYIAVNLVGDYFKRFPENINEITTKWMSSGNIWLQRSCVLFQLKYKEKIDFDLLTHFIEQLLGSKEFFINKAIGWILREISKTRPAFVLEFINQYDLNSLSQREALKWIQRRGLV